MNWATSKYKVHHKVESWKISHNFTNFFKWVRILSIARELLIWKNFNSEFVATFDMIPVKNDCI
jgi:hypothetical protein